MGNNIAPILVFAYNRLDTLQLTIEALQQNELASRSDIFIYCDAAKNEKDQPKVESVRNYVQRISGFNNVHVEIATSNKGLANSIISGVNQVLCSHDKVIIVEDDLVVSTNFLSFMNAALDFYKGFQNVSSISGYNPLSNIRNHHQKDVFFTRRTTSWGWATWKDRWSAVNWESDEFKRFPSSLMEWFDVYKLGSNLPSMIKRQNAGKINSWAIRFLYHHYKNGNLTLYPIKNMVRNIGFGKDATHTVSDKGFNHTIEQNNDTKFLFPEAIEEFKPVTKLFYKQYGIVNKIKTKFF